MSKAMAPPTRIDRALMFASVKSMSRLAAWTTDLMAAVILLPWIWYHWFSFLMLEMGVSPVALWHQIYATWKCVSVLDTLGDIQFLRSWLTLP